MKSRVVALSALLASSITGAAWVISANGSPPANRIDVVSSDANHAGPVSAAVRAQPKVARSRRVLGAWLLAVTGTAVVLRGYRSRLL